MQRERTTLGLVVTLCIILEVVLAESYSPRADIGYPAGLIPDCPGVTKNATISQSKLVQLQVVYHKMVNGVIVRKYLPVDTGHKALAKDKSLDFKNRKTMLYAVGFWDSSIFPQTQAVANAYVRRGYNVFVSETFHFLTYIYPKSVRLTKVIGRKLGEFLIKLMEQGLLGENLELVGASIGSHVAAFAAKHMFSKTGQKPHRLTGLDPAGPCFRSLPSEHRLAPTDATNVDVIHTNMDGFGMAERLGHVDFYVNGGEFQPGDIPYIPCLIVCSHVRAILYWWQALEHPKQFVALKCDSVQAARFAACYNNSETNYLGLETKFDRPGVFYLATHNEFPYFRSKEGLKPENEIYTSVSRRINSDDLIV